ncbi:MAG: hypothetical protein K2H20_00605, partial [Bacilli bacterium]|nr:hypothetical protein [Bacilli bacterium]
MKIIECTDEIVKQLPNVLGLIYSIFGESDVVVFATLNKDKKLGFVARVNEQCVYIDDKGDYTLFALNAEEELERIRIDRYVAFMDDLYFTDEDEKEYRLQMLPLTQPDNDGYDGYISFKQYDPKIDTFCEINYQQMYREIDGRAPIYGFRTQEIDGVYIDEKYNKSKGYIKGLPLPKRAKYYTKAAFENGEAGYDWIRIKDYGLAEFMVNRNFTTGRNREVRYVKSSYVRLDGSYGDLWPLAHQMKREEIDEIIKSYGFLSEVPSILLDIYNGSN